MVGSTLRDVEKKTFMADHDCQLPWVYKEIRDGLIAAVFLSMWMMGNLFDLHKNCVGKRL